MIQMVSAVSGHRFNMIRERLADKSELIKFDPWSKYKFSDLSSNQYCFLLFSSTNLSLPREKESSIDVNIQKDPAI